MTTPKKKPIPPPSAHPAAALRPEIAAAIARLTGGIPLACAILPGGGVCVITWEGKKILLSARQVETALSGDAAPAGRRKSVQSAPCADEGAPQRKER